MVKREPMLLGTSTEENALLESIGHAHNSLDDAVAAGDLVRTKITNRWLYATTPAAHQKGLELVEAEAICRIHPWMIGAAQWIQGPIAKSSANPQITVKAVELLLRALARDRRLRAIGLVSSGYEPYLGLYGPEDSDEVAWQVDAVMARLRTHGHVCAGDLPAPRRRRETDGWRSLILRHAEFLGLGRPDDDVLTAWGFDFAD